MGFLLTYAPTLPPNFAAGEGGRFFHHAHSFSLSPSLRSRNVFVASAIASPGKRTRRKKQAKDDESSSSSISSVSTVEKGLRFTFMEELMERARNRDVAGVSEVMYDMIAAGLNPGPRSFHGLIVSHVLTGNEEGAMQSLRRELSAGLCPLHETFVALVRLFGSKGHAMRGLEILAAMEKLDYDIRRAWLVLVGACKNNHLDDANKVFLKGAEGGLRATDELYDLIIEEDCKAGDHSNALTIAYEMEAAGRMATTFHFNCLLSVQATCGIPEIAFATFENMEYGGEDYMKPDIETYNWVIQAYTRAESYDRVQDVAELLGMMVEDHKRLQPNMKTYAPTLKPTSPYFNMEWPQETFYPNYYVIQKYGNVHYAVVCNVKHGFKISPPRLHIHERKILLGINWLPCRIVELLEALEAMAKDKQPIPPRAMILSRKYRTLVSSWIEPLQEEAELGYEIDYVARYIAEGGLTGDRKRWVPRRGKMPLDPDAIGFIYSNPTETSFKQHCLEEWRIHHRKLLKTLRNEGVAALGDASESEYLRVEERLKKIVKGPDKNALKPKAASKMIVSELKEELEAQGLPTDGTRNVLYQRVQKARRINRSRGRPLWVPPVEDEEEEVDEELDELVSRIKLEEGNTEFWKQRFLGQGVNSSHDNSDLKDSEAPEIFDDADAVEDVIKEVEDDEVDEEEEGLEQTESPEEDRVVKEKEIKSVKPLQMIGVQLLKDSDQTTRTSRKLRRKTSRISMEDADDDDWFPEDVHEAFKVMRERKIFDVSDMYTIADVWGWTWEQDLKNKPPRKWSQEWEVELAIKVMLKVIELGGTPTIGDCAMILHAAIRAPLPSAFLKILQTTKSLGYSFGSPLYDEIISLCLDLGELDAAIAIVADMETSGIAVPDQILDRVLSARQSVDNIVDGES